MLSGNKDAEIPINIKPDNKGWKSEIWQIYPKSSYIKPYQRNTALISPIPSCRSSPLIPKDLGLAGFSSLN